MPVFRYDGFDQAGGRVRSTIESESLDAATAELRARGVMLRTVKPADSSNDFRELLGLGEGRVGLAELEFMTAELSLLLESGVRIDRALAILQRSGKAGVTARLLNALSADVKQGKQLSEALASHPEVFDPLYINLVALGEASGRLSEVFRGLAEDLRFQRELRQKIISAATYPLIVALVCVMALVFILNFVVPNLESLFQDADELPWYTVSLLATSRFMQDWQFVLLSGLLLIGYLLYRFRKQPSVVEVWERLLLDFPGLRDAASMVERIRFCSGLGLMLDAGLPVDRALTLATGNIRHSVLRREMSAAVDKVKRGEQLSRVMRQTRLFPDYFSSLLEVGEEGGTLSRVFTEIARRSRDSFSAWTLRLTTLIEPLLILLMGLIVGGVVVIMMLSITSVADIGL